MISKLYKIIIGSAIAILMFVFVNWYFFSDDDLSRFELEETAIQIESIKEIAELGTITVEDEVVVDRIEGYESGLDAANGMIEKTFTKGIKSSSPDIKRRITLTTQAKIIFGFNLDDSSFQVQFLNDTVRIDLPEPSILDFIQNPSGNEIFIEEGSWSDNEVKQIFEVSRKKLERNFNEKRQSLDAKSRVEVLFKRLLPNREIQFEYH